MDKTVFLYFLTITYRHSIHYQAQKYPKATITIRTLFAQAFESNYSENHKLIGNLEMLNLYIYCLCYILCSELMCQKAACNTEQLCNVKPMFDVIL